MTNNRFTDLVHSILTEAAETLVAKGKDYAQVKDDRLINFKRRAIQLAKAPTEVLLNDMSKHFDSVCQAVQARPLNPSTTTEPLRGRIIDIINYNILLLALLEDINDTGRPEPTTAEGD